MFGCPRCRILVQIQLCCMPSKLSPSGAHTGEGNFEVMLRSCVKVTVWWAAPTGRVSLELW